MSDSTTVQQNQTYHFLFLSYIKAPDAYITHNDWTGWSQ